MSRARARASARGRDRASRCPRCVNEDDRDGACITVWRVCLQLCGCVVAWAHGCRHRGLAGVHRVPCLLVVVLLVTSLAPSDGSCVSRGCVGLARALVVKA